MNYLCTKSILQRAVQNQWMLGSMRTLFSKRFLGIDDYERQRSILLPFDSGKVALETDAGKLAAYVKYWVHALKKEECVDKFPKIRTSLRLIHDDPVQMKAYTFGPTVMRMLHYLDLPDQALQIFNDVKLPNMFVQLNSKVVLADLLFNHGKYDEMLEIISIDCEKQMNVGKESCTKLTCFALAACYKLNTEDRLKYGLELWNKVKEKENHPVHSANFLSMLAINLGYPETALEVLGSTTKTNPFNISMNIRIIAQADCGHFIDAAQFIKKNKIEFPNFNIFPSVIKRIYESLKKYPTTENKTNFTELLDTIPQSTSKSSIDEILFYPIDLNKSGVKTRHFSPNYKNIRRINREKGKQLDI